MKKIVSLSLLFFGLLVNAQEDVYDKIGQETCTCLAEKKLDLKDKTQVNNLTMTLGLCMVESYTNHKMELPEADRVEFNNNEGMKMLGGKVAIKMINHCPDFIIALGSLDDEDGTNVAAKEIKIEGKVTEVEIKQFVTIKLKDKNSRTYNLLLLNYFDTAALFTDGKIKAGTEITAGYTEVEMYDPESKDFKYFKVITSLEKK